MKHEFSTTAEYKRELPEWQKPPKMIKDSSTSFKNLSRYFLELRSIIFSYYFEKVKKSQNSIIQPYWIS